MHGTVACLFWTVAVKEAAKVMTQRNSLLVEQTITPLPVSADLCNVVSPSS